MIKINLLPGKKEKKKIGLKKELILFILSLAVMVSILILLEQKMSREKEALISQISSTKKEIAYYKSLTTEVEKSKEAQKNLENKLNIINTLRREKGSPARVLDQVSIDKPEKIHLESLKKQGSQLGIEGIALDDETVANFMTNLRKSRMFKSVDLIVTEQVELSKIKLKKFALRCEIIF